MAITMKSPEHPIINVIPNILSFFLNIIYEMVINICWCFPNRIMVSEIGVLKEMMKIPSTNHHFHNNITSQSHIKCWFRK